jgi:hypothetical protein
MELTINHWVELPFDILTTLRSICLSIESATASLKATWLFSKTFPPHWAHPVKKRHNPAAKKDEKTHLPLAIDPYI